ncbi:translation initiation factor IF-2 subunit beta [Candidatus Bathyarchaeota archaeon]|jgi:translation initiation factor 2 subunit 2|nr:translation initiation factor IF-2 subunit beta [Candidatus Bathyarchaeota archaeon]
MTSNMSEEYRKLLDRALSQLPEGAERKDRFVPPQAQTVISGNQTILLNLKEITDRIRRDKTQFVKHIAKELATSGSIDGNRVLFQGRFDNRTINSILDRYIQEFVICPVCHQPDTRIERKDRYTFLHCDACGAQSSVRGI